MCFRALGFEGGTTMIVQFLSRFSAPKADKPTMSPEDIEVIRAFAEGDESLRQRALAAHYRNIKIVGVRGNIYMRFMAEIDTPCPDLDLRNDLRHKIKAVA